PRFRRPPIEVLAVRLRICARMVDDPVPMIRRRVERVELQRSTAGVDDVVVRPGRDDHRVARADRGPNAVEDRLAATLLHAKELVELVDFRPDLLPGLQRQDDELAAPGRVQHAAELLVLDRNTLDVLHEAFHGHSPSVSSMLSGVIDTATLPREGLILEDAHRGSHALEAELSIEGPFARNTV